MNIRFVSIIILYHIFLAYDSFGDFRKASTHLVIGETNSLYLSPNGYSIHPFYNDITGGTDKLLTYSAKAGYIESDGNQSWEILVNWRLVVPIFKIRNGGEYLTKPIGQFADDLSGKTTFSQNFSLNESLNYKQQVSFGVHHLGDKNGYNLIKWVHQTIGSSVHEMPESKKGIYLAGGVLGGFWTQHTLGDSMISLGYEGHIYMHEVYVGLNFLTSNNFLPISTSLGYRFIRQIQSSYFDNIRRYRHELSFGVLVSQHYKPSIMFVSPYLKKDAFGQIYFDFINFYF